VVLSTSKTFNKILKLYFLAMSTNLSTLEALQFVASIIVGISEKHLLDKIHSKVEKRNLSKLFDI
jgi:hypothetical protein